jgi:hypothetical protein
LRASLQLEVYENQRLDPITGWSTSQFGSPVEPLCWSSAELEHTAAEFPAINLPVSWQWVDDAWKVRAPVRCALRLEERVASERARRLAAM